MRFPAYAPAFPAPEKTVSPIALPMTAERAELIRLDIIQKAYTLPFGQAENTSRPDLILPRYTCIPFLTKIYNIINLMPVFCQVFFVMPRDLSARGSEHNKQRTHLWQNR